MAEDIIQRMGFDASSAISQINALKGALDALNGSLYRTAKGVQNWNKAGRSIATSLKTAQSAAKNTAAALNNINGGPAAKNLNNVTAATNKAKNAGQGFTLSWQTMARIVTTRLGLGAFNKIVMALKQGTKDAMDFGIRIAEIGTIANKGVDLGKLRKELLEVSSLTGKGLSDVAEGFYQTLSNQVGTTTESLNVFNQAAKLSVATNASLEDSVNLLTSSLNAWQLGAGQAELISGKLFETVKLGRLRVKDLANVLGTVGPLASTMGISIEETLGSLANMTVQGTRANKAVTQLRAIMTQLLKPTDELQKLMEQEWGVTNAQQAVAMFGGMNNLLLELNKIAGGATDQMAEFFSNVRALSGVAAQTANIEKTTKALKGLRDEGDGLVDWAAKLVLDSEAKKAQVAFNNLNIALEETGKNLLGLSTIGAGGLAALVGVMDTLAVSVAAVGLTYLIANMNSAHAAMTRLWNGAGKLSASFKILAGAVAFTIGYELGKWLMNSAERMDELADATREASDAIAALTMSSIRKQKTLQDEAHTELLKGVTKYFADRQKLYAEDLSKASDAAKGTSKVIKKELSSLLGAQQKLVDGYADQKSKAYDQIEKSQTAALDRQRSVEQDQFDWSLEHLSALRKSYLQTDRSRELVSQGTLALKNAGTSQDQIDKAKVLLGLGLAQAKQASQSASSIQDQRQARVQLISTRQQELNAQEALIAADNRSTQASRIKAREASVQLEKQQKKLAEIQRYIEAINKGSDPYDESGRVKSGRDLKKDREKAYAAMKDLRAAFGTEEMKGIITVADMFDLGSLARNIQGEVGKLPTLETQLHGNYIGLKTALEEANKRTPIELQVKLKALGYKGTGAPESQSKFILDLQKQAKLAGPDLDKIKGLMTTITSAINELPKLKDVTIAPFPAPREVRTIEAAYADLLISQKRLETADFTPGAGGEKILAEHEAKLVAFNKLVHDLTVGEGMLANAMDAVAKSAASILPESEIPDMMKMTMAALNQTAVVKKLAQARKELAEADPGGTRYTDLQADVSRYQRALQAVPTSPLGQAIKTDVVNPIEQMTPLKLINGMSNAKLAAQDIKRTIESIVPPKLTIPVATQTPGGTSGTPTYKSTGGLIKYLAGGGFAPRGTDTVPAMLSPGEFVVNARSTRKFYSQLVALNSGSQPVYRAQGGPVTNQTIGDINVNVKGGSSSVQTAREIATGIRRELRRNTVSLK